MMDVVSALTEIEIQALLERLSSLTTVFQAIGGLIIAYIVFSIINTVFNRKKRNELRRMRILLERIEKKLGNTQIIKKKK